MQENKSGPAVGIIVLNWNSYTDIANCLDTVMNQDYNNTEIIVVDNGSTDNSAQRLENDYPFIDLVELDKNAGFSKGNNIGIKQMRDRDIDYIWLVNNDIRLPEPSILGKIIDAMERNPEIGILTPQIMEYPETDTVWFRKGVINQNLGVYYHNKNRKWYVHGQEKSTTKIEDSSTQTESELLKNEYLPFSCALFRETLFSEVGLLPEEYFLYVEDVEYGLRTMNAGYQLATIADVKVYHEKSSDSSLNPIRSYYGVRNNHLFVRRNSEEVNLLLFYPIYILLILLLFGQRVLERNFASAKAVIRGFIDAIQMKDGKGPYP